MLAQRMCNKGGSGGRVELISSAETFNVKEHRFKAFKFGVHCKI